MLTLEEFREKRDRFALDGYYQRWPILNDRKNKLRKKIDGVKKLLDTPNLPLVLVSNAKHGLEEDKYKLLTEYSDVVSELALIEEDAPLRKMNLGLIPVPKDLSLELRMRLDSWKAKSGSKGISEITFADRCLRMYLD